MEKVYTITFSMNMRKRPLRRSPIVIEVQADAGV
jgi:hypothetical protein